MYNLTNGQFAATFIHIPKTGGTAVTDIIKKNFQTKKINVFSGNDMRHVPIKFIRDRIVGEPFCFVRHPLKWYESVYKMIDDYADGGNVTDFKSRRNIGFNPIGIAAYFYAPTFSEWIENILKFAPDYYVEVIRYFMGNDYDEIKVVGHTETLLDDLERILQRQGLGIGKITVDRRIGGRQHKNHIIEWGEGQEDYIMEVNQDLQRSEHFKHYFETINTNL